MEGFTIKCNKCGREQEITPTSDLNGISITGFITYDTCNATVICECGNGTEE